MAERQSRSQLQVPGFDKPLDLLQSHRAHYEASQHRVLEFTLTKDDAEVATATALIIHKDNLRGRWYAELDIHSSETAQVSQFFDNYGRLRPYLLENEVQKGTGVWGKELDEGSILLIEYIRVEPDYRQLGIATRLLKEILASPLVRQQCSWAFAWPTFILEADTTGAQKRSMDAVLVSMFRNVGFRRMGRSSFFCLPMIDQAHPAFSLSIDQDVDYLVVKIPGAEESEDDGTPLLDQRLNAFHEMCLFSNNDRRNTQAKLFPLHFAAFDRNTSDINAVEMLDSRLLANPAIVHQVDNVGVTILHLAASAGKIRLIERLLQAGASVEVIDKEGYNPLERLENRLWLDRACDQKSMRSFTGYTDAQAQCLHTLRQAKGKVVLPGVHGWEHWRYGFASEEIASDLLQETEQMPAGKNLSKDHVFALQYAEHIPVAIRRAGISKHYVLGFASHFESIAILLRRDEVPSPAAVKQHASMAAGAAPSPVQQYYRKAGLPDHALAATIRLAETSSILGDETGLFEEDFEAEHKLLPECGNDLDFRHVRERMGIPREFWLEDLSE